MTSPARKSSAAMSARISLISSQFFFLQGQQALSGLRVAQNGRQRLIDFVGQGGGQLAHRCNTCHVRKFFTALARLPLGPAPSPVLNQECDDQAALQKKYASSDDSQDDVLPPKREGRVRVRGVGR